MEYRILNKSFSPNKKLVYSLCSIFGIGESLSKQYCYTLGYNEDIRLNAFTQEELDLLVKDITLNYVVEKDLERAVFFKKKLQQDVESYRGIRARMGLPVKGQRTKTNSRTVRKLLGRKI